MKGLRFWASGFGFRVSVSEFGVGACPSGRTAPKLGLTQVGRAARRAWRSEAPPPPPLRPPSEANAVKGGGRFASQCAARPLIGVS